MGRNIPYIFQCNNLQIALFICLLNSKFTFLTRIRDVENKDFSADPPHVPVYRSTPTPPPPWASVGPMSTNRVKNPNATAVREKPRQVQHYLPPHMGGNQTKKMPSSQRAQPYVPPPKPPHEGQENVKRKKVIVPHLESPGEFYVRFEQDQESFQSMSDLLTQQLDSKAELVPFSELSTGLVCAVKADDKWSRCRIVRLDEAAAKVFLLDFGKCLSIPVNAIYQLAEIRGKIAPPLCYCRLWGVRPAGDSEKWSRTSADNMAESVKKASSVYIQEYFNEVEEDEDGSLREIRYVQFFHEYVLTGGPLECDQVVTGCVNDKLLDEGLALRKPMKVNVQPMVKRWLPSLILPPQLDAIPRWIDSEGFIYIQHLKSSPFCHVDVINKLLDWYYSNVSPEPDTICWEEHVPCVAR